MTNVNKFVKNEEIFNFEMKTASILCPIYTLK